MWIPGSTLSRTDQAALRTFLFSTVTSWKTGSHKFVEQLFIYDEQTGQICQINLCSFQLGGDGGSIGPLIKLGNNVICSTPYNSKCLSSGRTVKENMLFFPT